MALLTRVLVTSLLKASKSIQVFPGFELDWNGVQVHFLEIPNEIQIAFVAYR